MSNPSKDELFEDLIKLAEEHANFKPDGSALSGGRERIESEIGNILPHFTEDELLTKLEEWTQKNPKNTAIAQHFSQLITNFQKTHG